MKIKKKNYFADYNICFLADFQEFSDNHKNVVDLLTDAPMFVFLGILSFNFDCFVLLFLYIFFNLDLLMNRNTSQSLCVIRFNFMYAHTGNFDKCTNYSIPVSNFFSMTYLICLIKKKI